MALLYPSWWLCFSLVVVALGLLIKHVVFCAIQAAKRVVTRAADASCDTGCDTCGDSAMRRADSRAAVAVQPHAKCPASVFPTRFIGWADCLHRACQCDSGCGEVYWGGWYGNPPCCDPCDPCGNWGRRLQQQFLRLRFRRLSDKRCLHERGLSDGEKTVFQLRAIERRPPGYASNPANRPAADSAFAAGAAAGPDQGGTEIFQKIAPDNASLLQSQVERPDGRDVNLVYH